MFFQIICSYKIGMLPTARHYDDFNVDWTFQFAAEATAARYAGGQANDLYATYKGGGTGQYHTVIHLGSHFADGCSTESSVLDAIWANFAAKGVSTWDGQPLHFYDSYTVPWTQTRHLLRFGDGQCGAWAHLFMNTLHAQGIDKQDEWAKLSPITDDGFLVKDWSFSGSGTSGDTTYPYLNIGDGVNWKTASGYQWRFSEANDEDDTGISGQNTSDPASLFACHYVINSN